MAYFHETNIDYEFDRKKKFGKKRNKNFNNDIKKFNVNKKVIIGLFLCFIVLGLIIFFTLKNRNMVYDIIIEGDSEVTIYQGSEYVEFGYHGYDKNKNDVTNLVKVSGTVDVNTIGEYTITYTLGNAKKIRIVKVIDKGIGDTYLYLKGDLIIYLDVGEKYIEPGYSVIDTVDGDLSAKMKIDGDVDTTKAGTYKLVYSVVNSAGVTTSATRTVIVLGSEVNLTLSNSSKTTGPIYINVYVNDNYFDYLVLPNGTKVTENKYSYKVSSNGTYKFIAYNTRGTKTEKSIKVENIYVEVNSGSTGGSSSSSGSGSSSSGGNSNSSGSSGNNQNVSINMPKVYTSDNIGSGNKHSVGFLLKLTSNGNTIYYCTDTDNKCNPSTKYAEQLRFATSTNKYLRYKACNSSNQCSNIGSYKINLSISNKNPSESTSGGKANPNQAAFYRQDDSRWANSTIPVSPYRTIAAAGCGYTSLAMIITGITHDYTVTPKKVISGLESSNKRYYYVESNCSGCGGMMYYYASYNPALMSKYNYDTYELFNQWNSISSDDTKEYKIEAISESLKMGHLILVLVPNHYIALVGMDSSENVYIFNPAGDAWTASVSYMYSYYYDYNSRCTNRGECGLQIGYEFYPKGGMSLKEWRAIK